MRDGDNVVLSRTNFVYPKSVIRLLHANEAIFLFLFRYFSVTMEPHCALKAPLSFHIEDFILKASVPKVIEG